MKRYLIRASFDPCVFYNAYEFILKGHAGMNSGNLMFAYGVMNVLTTEEVVFETTYKHLWSDKDAEEINEKYDGFILPMADAFRDDYVNDLDEYTKLIRKLKIPVIVIGIGLRAKYNEDPTEKHWFDTNVYNFVKEVLNHSSIIGLRGRNTGKYLSKLGFIEDRDFTPIGCPSLYTYGMNVHTKIPNRIKSMVINTSTSAPQNNNDFIINSAQRTANYWMVQQSYYEMRDMLVGRHSFIGRKTVANVFDKDTFQQMNKEDRIRYFFNVPEWIDFMADKDFFIGNRFHGSVAAILAGTPHVLLPFDARMKELAEFHHITTIYPQMIDGKKSIYDYIDNLDLKSFEKHHKDNFDHYIDFLEKNDLDHIFKKKHYYSRGESFIERNQPKNPPIILHPIQSLSTIGKCKRVLKIDSLVCKSLWNKKFRRN